MSTPPPFPSDFPSDDWSIQGERPVDSAFANPAAGPFQPPQQPGPPQPVPFSQPGPQQPAPFSQPGPAAPFPQQYPAQYGQQQYGQQQYGQQQYPSQYGQPQSGQQYPAQFPQQQNPYAQQAPYGYQQYGTVQSVQSQTNGLAVASMVLGIVGIVLFCLYAIPSILAVIFGGVALSQIKKDPKYSGRGMAVAGLVTGLVGVSLLALVLAAGNGVFWIN